MISLGITGGIGSGKSYISKKLEMRGIPVFYTDNEAKSLMLQKAEIKDALCELIGDDAYCNGMPSSQTIRNFLTHEPGADTKINNIVHPFVIQQWKQWKSQQNCPILAMECALLFETGFDSLVDYSVVVSAPEELRIERVMKRNSLSRSAVEKMIALQMPEKDKLSRAWHIINNDTSEGNDNALMQQIDQMLKRI